MKKKITALSAALMLIFPAGCSDKSASDVLDPMMSSGAAVDSSTDISSVQSSEPVLDMPKADHDTPPEGVVLAQVPTLEIYEKVTWKDIISNTDVILKDPEGLIDTSVIGKCEQNICYTYEGETYSHPFSYEVSDTTPPIILNAGGNGMVVCGEAFDLSDLIGYADNYDPKPVLTYEGNVDTTVCGSYPITYTITDKYGNATSHELEINVVDEKPEHTPSDSRTSFEDIKKNYAATDVCFGIDVSKWQYDIDFNAVKNAGCEFVIMRIGHYDYEYTLDSYYTRNIKAAKAAGLKVGVYMYTMANTREEIIENAKWINEHLNGEELDYPIAFDFEDFHNFQEFEMSIHDLNELYELFDEEMTKYGYSTMLYSSKMFLDNFWYEQADHPIWLAHYTDYTDYSGEYAIWQMCSDGDIDGVDGNCDVDIMYTDKMKEFE